jgi:hypothetical protein
MSMKRRPPHAAQKWRGFRFNVRTVAPPRVISTSLPRWTDSAAYAPLVIFRQSSQWQ